MQMESVLVISSATASSFAVGWKGQTQVIGIGPAMTMRLPIRRTTKSTMPSLQCIQRKPNRFSVTLKLAWTSMALFHGFGVNQAVIVGNDLVAGVALVNNGLEDLHALHANVSAAQPANKLLTLPAEHWPTR